MDVDLLLFDLIKLFEDQDKKDLKVINIEDFNNSVQISFYDGDIYAITVVLGGSVDKDAYLYNITDKNDYKLGSLTEFINGKETIIDNQYKINNSFSIWVKIKDNDLLMALISIITNFDTIQELSKQKLKEEKEL